MTYSLRYKVPMPIGMYDGLHAVVKETPGGQDGIMVHLGWETADGFEIIEIWESKDAYNKFVQDVWPQVVDRLGQGPIEPPHGAEFNLRGLVLSETRSVYI